MAQRTNNTVHCADIHLYDEYVFARNHFGKGLIILINHLVPLFRQWHDSKRQQEIHSA